MTEERFNEIIEEIYFNRRSQGIKPAKEIYDYIKELEHRLSAGKNDVLHNVSNSLPDTRGDKIRKHINPSMHFIDWLIDNKHEKDNKLYELLDKYKIDAYGNDC